MAAIRRGIPGYAEGNPNTPADPLGRPTPITRLQDVKAGQQAVVDAPPTSGMGQVFAGDFAGARDNPESSPATAMLGQFADYLNRSTRLDAVSRGPSLKDRLGNLFFGNQASTAAIEQHDRASQALRDPLVQQHLMNNPDELKLAETNRLGYAAKTQTPEFRKVIETAVAANAAAAANPKVTPDEHPKVVATATNTGATADQAHAALAPRKYTEDEFVNTFKGIPTATFALLFGNQLQHVRTPQEKGATEFFDRLHGAHADASKRVNDMIAQDAELRKQGKNPIHSQGSWFGKSPLAIAQEQQAATQKAIMDAIASYTGISQKPFQVPPTQ